MLGAGLFASLVLRAWPALAGCAQVGTDGACAVAPGAELRVWAPTPEAVHWGPLPWPVWWALTEDGALGRLPAPPGGWLRVGEASVALTLPPSCPALEAGEGRAAGELIRHLDAAPPAADPRCAPLRAGRRARAVLREGAYAAALAELEASAAQAWAAGLRSAWRDDGLAAAFVATWRTRELDRAAALLAERAEEPDPVGRVRVHYAQAQLALELGEVGAALDHLDRSVRWRARLQLQEGDAAGRQLHAIVLRRLGRYAAAERVLERLARESGRHQIEVAVQRAANRVYWATAHADAPAPEPALREAEALLERYDRPESRAALQANQARWALWRGDAPAARRALAVLEGAPGHVAERIALFHAELAVLEGDQDAAERLRALAEATDPLSEQRWYAWMALGRAALRAGRHAAAAAWFREAEATARAQWVLVPPGAGRGATAGARAATTAALVSALLGDGRASEAADALRAGLGGWLASLVPPRDPATRARLADLRKAQARIEAARRTAPAAALAALDGGLSDLQAAVNQLMADALTTSTDPSLAPPPPGVLYLLFAEGPGGPTALLQTADGTTVRSLGARPATAAPAALGGWLLAPVADALQAHRKVWLFPGPGFDDLDLHALPVDGVPLGLWRPVVYGLDLPAAAPAPVEGTLLVRDPTGDLPHARRAGWPGARVLHQRAATRAALWASPVARLVFAGHGKAAGVDGWQSAVLLAGQDRLTVTDALLAPWTPAEVVLLACRSGVDRLEDAPAVGLAQAFLVAGARRAIGTRRPLDDALAARLTAGLARRAEIPLPRALMEALRDEAEADPAVDWASVRMWGRPPGPVLAGEPLVRPSTPLEE